MTVFTKDIEKLLQKWIEDFDIQETTHKKILFFLDLYDSLPYKPLINNLEFRTIITEKMTVESMSILDGIHHFFKNKEKEKR